MIRMPHRSSRFRSGWGLSLAALCGGLAACAPVRPAIAPPAATAPAGHSAAISAADPRAAEAGAEMLRKGGSAVDAAIATMLALNVVEPQSSGIGGGGFLVLAGPDGTVETLDGRESAPAAAGPDWFVADGKPLTLAQAVPGGRSVGVPGNLRLAAMAHAKQGKLAWKELFGPAIRLARGGFTISPRLAASVAQYHEPAGFDAAGRALFMGADGTPLTAGTTVRNTALAETLSRIAAQGPDAFYTGANARAISRAVQASPRTPAALQESDIAGYRAVERAPVCGTYRAYRICGMGPPSAGAIIVIQVLGQLARFDMAGLGKDSPVAWHLIAEAERLAYADRDRFVADPDFVTVPVKGLLDPKYIAARSALISESRAMPAALAGSPDGIAVRSGPAPAQPENGTSHFAVVDKWGRAASYTSTIESGFGSGLVVGGYYLNNELTDFSFVAAADGKPVANRVEAGKRPRSSMSPVVVFDPQGRLWLAGGAAGGATIPAQVIRMLIGKVDWGLSAREAIGLGIVMPGASEITVEAGTPLEAMVPALVALGHTGAKAVPMRLKANAVERTPQGWQGAADPRSEGAGVTP